MPRAGDGVCSGTRLAEIVQSPGLKFFFFLVPMGNVSFFQRISPMIRFGCSLLRSGWSLFLFELHKDIVLWVLCLAK